MIYREDFFELSLPNEFSFPFNLFLDCSLVLLDIRYTPTESH